MRPLQAIAAISAITFLGVASAFADGVTVKQVTKAKTGEELVQLGASRLSAADFKARVVGKQMTDVGKTWTWIIKSNGKTESAAADGSWSDASAWKMKGDTYCREVEGSERCSDVYLIGGYLRMTEGSGDTLSGWTVKLD